MITKGILFGNIHSYRNLDLVLSAVEITPAIPKENYVEIKGGHGSLDLTEAHGEVKYGDRQGCKFDFTINSPEDGSSERFEAKKTEVSNALNGKYFERIILDKDSGYFYSGRCAVSEYLSDKALSQIVVTARLKPWKLKVAETVAYFTLTGTEITISLKNARKPVVPTIECTSDNTKVVFGNHEITMNEGTHKFLDICLTEGDNVLKVSGNGGITFTYQEGDL